MDGHDRNTGGMADNAREAQARGMQGFEMNQTTGSEGRVGIFGSETGVRTGNLTEMRGEGGDDRGREDLARARGLGEKILTYNEDVEGDRDERIWATEQEREAYEDLRSDSGERTSAEGGELAGVETSVQIKERLAEDQEDLRNEEGLNGMYTKDLMDRNKKQITTETMNRMEKIAKSDNISEMDMTMNQCRRDFQAKVYGRIWGARN